MKRSNEYTGPSTGTEQHKKQRFGQSPYGYMGPAGNVMPGGGSGPMNPHGHPHGHAHGGLPTNQQLGQQQPGQNAGGFQGGNDMYGGQFNPHFMGNQFQQPQGQVGQYGQNQGYGVSHQYSSGYGQTGSMQGQYSPSGINPDARTVYLGNLPMGITLEEVLNYVKGGILENVKIFDDKNCAFITFIDATAAANFYNEATSKRLSFNGQECKIGWGKTSAVSPPMLTAVNSGASRNVFIGNIDESIDDGLLRSEFSKFGPVDTVKILVDKRIAFVHMNSITAAMKAVASLPTDPRWASRRINYGKDRCAPHMMMKPGSQQSGGGAAMMYGNQFMNHQFAGNMPFGNPQAMGFDPFTGQSMSNAPGASGSVNVGGAPNAQGGHGHMNRTVYLGAINPDVTTKDLCDVIRGGILQHIKYMPDKNIAFVTFVDPNAAHAFYNRATYEGFVVKSKRLKVGWGKASNIPPSVVAAVASGASRNVYIGSLNETVTEDKLRKDFSEFGDIELVNIISDKNIGFVNFTDIMSAVKAVETMKLHPEYSRFKINYGKDRCGNTPRPRNASNNSNNANSDANANVNTSANAGAGAGAGAAVSADGKTSPVAAPVATGEF